jgi:hypothetical protein
MIGEIRDRAWRKRVRSRFISGCQQSTVISPMRGENPLLTHSLPCENEVVNILTESKIPQNHCRHVFRVESACFLVGLYESLTVSLRKLNQTLLKN